MPTLVQPQQTTEESLSPGRPLAEQQHLDQAALSGLREFFLILDAWDRAETQKLSADVRSPVDNPPRQAQGDRNTRREK